MIEIRVLGPIEVTRDGEPVAIGGPRQRALLALLAVQPGRARSADWLADELWADEAPPGSSVTLRTYISRLRKVLEPDLSIRAANAAYNLHVDPGKLDLGRFELLVRDAEVAYDKRLAKRTVDLLDEASELWRGDPFEGGTPTRTLALEGQRIAELRLRAVELRIEAQLALGGDVGLVNELETLVSEQPYRERFWALLMTALYREGRQADALAAYHRARRLLRDQLGVEPGDELQRVQGLILRHEVPQVRPVEERHNLPASLTSFVGRGVELAEIAVLLDEHRLVTLTGVGGVGKTRVAIEAARISLGRRPDGVQFVDLAGTHDQTAVTTAIYRGLELRELPKGSAIEMLIDRLRRVDLLLVLDNCEHVRADCAEVAVSLLSACPEVRILATSRVPLGAPGEVDYPLAPLDLPGTGASEDEILKSESVRLLLERTREVRPRVSEDASLLADAVRICRDLDGLPLAIELAAARAKALSLAEIAGRLDDRFRFLVSWRRVSSSRHSTLKEAIDWSYDLLATEEQSLFVRLSSFAGGFGADAVSSVFLDGDLEAAIPLIGRLVDASLVTAGSGARTTRYSMLETVRQYAAVRLRERGETEEAGDRHAQYFTALAERAEPGLTAEDQATLLAALEAEHDNLRAALEYVSTIENWDLQLRLTIALTRFWYVRGYLREARRWLEAAIDRSEGHPAELRRRILTAGAAVALIQGDYTTSLVWAEASLQAAREMGEPRLVANGLSNLGAIALAAGDHDRAGALLAEAVDLARANGDPRVLALAINNLGDHALTVGDLERAQPLFEESLALLVSRGDTSNVARSQFNLGAVALRQGRLDDAEIRFYESLARSRETGDQEDLAWCLLGIAGLCAERGDGQRAALLLGAAEAHLEQMGAALKPFERHLHDDTEARARSLLGHEEFADIRRRGAAAPIDSVVANLVSAG